MLTPESATRKDRRAAPTMEHRHFATVAAIIRDMPADMREDVARHFADNLGCTNARFDRARFLRACRES